MVSLTRLNGHRVVVNPDLIKFADATPDTTLTLTSGERLIVQESCDELVSLIADWRGETLRRAWPVAPALTDLTNPAVDASTAQQD